MTFPIASRVSPRRAHEEEEGEHQDTPCAFPAQRSRVREIWPAVGSGQAEEEKRVGSGVEILIKPASAR